MKSETFTTVVINADENKYLTQVADVELKDRIIAKTIALGKFDSAENYKEISQEEGDQLKADKEKLIKELAENERD